MTNENKSELYKWWSIFKQNHKLVEIRVIGNKRTFSGYYKNIENLIRDVEQHYDDNIYFTIGNINEACYGRPQCEQMVMNPKNTTSDAEITSRDFVFLDFDCVHGGVAGINSTDEEKHLARLKTVECYRWLLSQGFSSIIAVDSGNSYHLYIPCRMAGTSENDEMVKRFTLAISMIFSDENVQVDEKVYNKGRIAKLPSSYSRKGSSYSTDRPQRQCKILLAPDEITPNDNAYFQKVADLYPEPEKPSAQNNYQVGKFDLDGFLQRHNIEVAKVEQIAGGKKYILKHCVFNEQHKGKDAVIFQRDDGAIAYHCFHQSCAHYTWRDVRIKFEPDAYTRKEVAEYNQRQRYYGVYQRPPFQPLPETEELGKKWLAASEIKRVEIDELAYVSMGYPEIDKAMWGLFMGDVTVLTGTSGSGKSSLLACIVNNLVERNVKVAMYSGELQGFRLMGWQYCSLAGKTYTKKKEGYDNWYYAPKNICDKIDNWLSRKLLIYNNNYGNNFFQLFSDIKEAVDFEHVSVVVIDNMSALDLSEYPGKDLERQTKFITDLKSYAKVKNIHIILVVHPRKQSGDELNQKESVAGSNNLTNLVDNVLIVSRRGIDFMKRLSNFMGAERAKEYEQYDTIVQLCKCRMSGQQDRFFGLFYEPESRRIKNTKAEHINYGWCAEPTQQVLSAPTSNITMPFEAVGDEEAPF
jgi:archaellum biogenesis ATPase FlaH